ncbi:uncharacterized protein LOC110732047 isoform X1 [Chenopodium quinoa]|uniref:Sulfotransferase n=1 Tax=Chenopodium quinoa TaxID=63459 RepID=A0A803N2G5_CHEQI|nr:uncharacterized protein LOC110732047 isoform X1 [Chenopodium quinoa]
MKRAQENGIFDKEKWVIKGGKRSPLLMRMGVLVIIMVCGVYICLTGCFNVVKTPTIITTTSKFIKSNNFQVNFLQCQSNSSEFHYIHYPKPLTFSREECECNPVRPFAILSMQRSGSGWFETMLNSHINVSSNGEIFSVKERRNNVSMILKTLDQVYNLDWFNSASKNECSAAVGLKWMLNQGLMENQEEIVKYFNQKGVSAIFLFRRNLLRRMISVLANSYDKSTKLLNGTHKSHVHSSVEAQVLASYKPKINATEIELKLKQEEAIIDQALESFNSTRHIVLYYEDLISNRIQKLQEVQEFLSVPYRNLTSRQVKIHGGPLANQVENWDELESILKKTSYERFLHADYR